MIMKKVNRPRIKSLCNTEVRTMNEHAKLVCEKAVIKYGPDEQVRIAQEECAELIQAISKCCRYGLRDEHLENLIEEMADVTICIEQLKTIIEITAGVNEAKLEAMVEHKITKLEKRWEEKE